MKTLIDDDGEIKRCRIELFAWMNHSRNDPEYSPKLKLIKSIIKHHPTIPDEAGQYVDLDACGGIKEMQYGIEWDQKWDVPVAVFVTYGDDCVCVKAFNTIRHAGEEVLTKLCEQFGAYATFAKIAGDLQEEETK